jgi:hypothetical protein
MQSKLHTAVVAIFYNEGPSPFYIAATVSAFRIVV